MNNPLTHFDNKKPLYKFFDGTEGSAKDICDWARSQMSKKMEEILMGDTLMSYIYSDNVAKDFQIECPEGTQLCEKGDLVIKIEGEFLVFKKALAEV